MLPIGCCSTRSEQADIRGDRALSPEAIRLGVNEVARDPDGLIGVTARHRRVCEWRIHLGAHKTATTHLQEILALKRKELVASGIDFIPNPEIRQSGFAEALRARSLAARIPGLRARQLTRILDERIEPLRAGPDRVILSEENLIGGLQCAWGTPAYPHAGAVSKLKHLAQVSEVCFFLSIRSFDKQVPSSYAQALKIVPPRQGGFEAIRQRILSRPPSWADLVRRIRSLAPNIPLVVWRQEDYRAHTEEILAVLCGRPVCPLPQIEDPIWTRSPSAEAVRAAEDLPRNMIIAERRAKVRKIYLQAGGRGGFRPFSQSEAAALRAAYAADVARIAEMDSVTLLKFA